MSVICKKVRECKDKEHPPARTEKAVEHPRAEGGKRKGGGAREIAGGGKGLSHFSPPRYIFSKTEDAIFEKGLVFFARVWYDY